MTQFTIAVIINKSVEIVYQAFIDPDNMLKWSTDLEKFKIVKGEFGEIGATMQLYYNQKGRIHIMEDMLEYLEAGKKIISQVSGGGLVARVETTFNSNNGKTQVSMNWRGNSRNLLFKILLPLLRNTIRKRALSELELFKKLVEEFGEKFK